MAKTAKTKPRITKKVRQQASAKMSELKGCLCTQFMPYRMQHENKKAQYGYTFGLGCMMCSRYLEADTPREVIDGWNAKHTTDALRSAS